MSSFDYGEAFSAFWTAQGKAMLEAQDQAGKMMAEGLHAMASGSLPLMPGVAEGPAGAELARAQQALGELWSAATAMSGVLAKAVPGAGEAGDATVAATVNRLVDPRSWMGGVDEMGDVLGRMAEGPRLADLWDLERRYARVMQAWITVRRTGLEHNAVVLEAWVQAGKRFTEEMAARTDPKPDARAAMALWTETANRQLLEAQRSEAFLATQTAMIRGSTELRMAQQELVEHLGKQYGFPTRTELDDVHRTVTEMRRELRALRREVRLAAVVPAVVPAAVPAAGARRAKRVRA